MAKGLGWPLSVSPAHWPMNYLQTSGPRADPVTGLTWGLIVLSISVCVIITALVLAGVLIRRRRSAADAPVTKGPDGHVWIWAGLVPTVIALAGALVWTMAALAAVDSPPHAPALTIEITGRQWWWEVRYAGSGGSFLTANEIHIPVGRPVLIKLYGGDVIHSFWIPALTGKTDTIPGQTNLTWLQADRPGVYRGQCTEYCGAQHAHMAAYVIAEPQAAFDAWRRAQLAPAPMPASADERQGQDLFVDHCSRCHAISGVQPRPGQPPGVPGPDLTHLMSRSTLAGGTLPNTTGALSGWISDPRALKPGTPMPATGLSGRELGEVRAYLETLK